MTSCELNNNCVHYNCYGVNRIITLVTLCAVSHIVDGLNVMGSSLVQIDGSVFTFDNSGICYKT
jgi:hypothetical protein